MKFVFLLLMATVGIAANRLSASVLPQDPLPTQARWAINVNVQALMASPLGETILKNLPGTPLNDEIRAGESATSICLTRDVSHLIVCGNGDARQDQVVYLRGNGLVGKLSACLANPTHFTTHSYGTHVTMSWLDSEAPSGSRKRLRLFANGCIVSASLVVFATSETALNRALDALDGKTPGSRCQQLAPMSEQTVLHVMAVDIPNIMPGDSESGNGLLRIGLQQAESFRLDVKMINRDMQATAMLHAKTADGAVQLRDLILGFQGIALLQAGRNPELAQAAQSVKMVVDGENVHMSVMMPIDRVERLLGIVAPSSHVLHAQDRP